MLDNTPLKAATKIVKSEAQWRELLTPEQFHVTREHGTERAFSHAHTSEKRPGTYRCVGCGEPLFGSADKFDSGTGWPSYTRPLTNAAVCEQDDHALAMKRTEVLCTRCAAHLGHVFADGPQPTGLRYCINGLALQFEPDAA